MSVLSGLDPRFRDKIPTFLFPDTADLYQPTKTKADNGQEKRTFSTATYSDVPCRKAPASSARRSGNERSFAGQQVFRQEYDLMLKGDYSAITNEWRVKISNIWYEIISPTPDGNKILTKVLIAEIKPFNS